MNVTVLHQGYMTQSCECLEFRERERRRKRESEGEIDRERGRKRESEGEMDRERGRKREREMDIFNLKNMLFSTSVIYFSCTITWSNCFCFLLFQIP